MRAVAWLVAVAALCLAALVIAPKAPAAQSRKVLAFYYTWYGTPSHFGSWRHWDEGGHNPDKLGFQQMPDIGATDHPLELYDSHDPVAIRRHLAQARSAGIDAFISTWWYQKDYHDQAFELLLEEAAKTPIRVCPYYEVVPAGPDPAAAVAGDFDYLLTRYGRHKAFFRDSRGRPVIFVYSRAMGQLTREQWARALGEVRRKHRVSVIADSTDASWLEIFDGLHEYNPVGAVVGGENLPRRARSLVERVRAHAGDKTACLTVIPGYDDSNIGRTTPIIAPRHQGDTYRRMWTASLDADPDWVLICSFNEWHEGSEIEPSREYGDLFLRMTEDYAALFGADKPFAWRSGYSTGFEVEPSGGLKVTLSRDRTGPLRIRGVSLEPGEITVGWPRERDLVVFEEGRDGLLWRLVPVTLDSRGRPRWLAGSGRTYQVWRRAEFVQTRPDSPFAAPVSWGLAPDASGAYPAEEPLRYRVYPGSAFPLKVSLRNGGSQTLSGGRVTLTAPEGWWRGGEVTLFESLPPGQTAEATLEVTPGVDADLNQPHPVLVWYHARSGDTERRFWTAVELEPVAPVAPTFTYEAPSTLHVTLKSLFPGLEIPAAAVDFVPGDGRSAEPRQAQVSVTDEARVSTQVTGASDAAPGLRRTVVTLRVGGFTSTHVVTDTATVALGRTDTEQGVRHIQPEDGRSEPVTEAGSEARRSVPFGPQGAMYLYFTVVDTLPTAGRTYVTVEYLDRGRGGLQLQYDSAQEDLPMEGAYKNGETLTLTDSGEWRSHTFTVEDARFSGRQNGGADFRFAVLGGEPAVLKRVTVSKWPG